MSQPSLRGWGCVAKRCPFRVLVFITSPTAQRPKHRRPHLLTRGLVVLSPSPGPTLWSRPKRRRSSADRLDLTRRCRMAHKDPATGSLMTLGDETAQAMAYAAKRPAMKYKLQSSITLYTWKALQRSQRRTAIQHAGCNICPTMRGCGPLSRDQEEEAKRQR